MMLIWQRVTPWRRSGGAEIQPVSLNSPRSLNQLRSVGETIGFALKEDRHPPRAHISSKTLAGTRMERRICNTSGTWDRNLSSKKATMSNKNDMTSQTTPGQPRSSSKTSPLTKANETHSKGMFFPQGKYGRDGVSIGLAISCDYLEI